MFQFESLAAFIAMGGHGPYVWISYAVTLLTLIWLVIAPIRGRRRLLKNLSHQSRSAVPSGEERS